MYCFECAQFLWIQRILPQSRFSCIYGVRVSLKNPKLAIILKSAFYFNSIALLQILNGSLQVGYFRFFKSASDFVVLPFTMYLFTSVLRLWIQSRTIGTGHIYSRPFRCREVSPRVSNYFGSRFPPRLLIRYETFEAHIKNHVFRPIQQPRDTFSPLIPWTTCYQ